MIKSYRTLWNEALGAWVAAPEIAKAKGKPNGSSVAEVAPTSAAGRGSRRMAVAISSALAMLAWLPLQAQASHTTISNDGGSQTIDASNSYTNALDLTASNYQLTLDQGGSIAFDTTDGGADHYAAVDMAGSNDTFTVNAGGGISTSSQDVDDVVGVQGNNDTINNHGTMAANGPMGEAVEVRDFVAGGQVNINNFAGATMSGSEAAIDGIVGIDSGDAITPGNQNTATPDNPYTVNINNQGTITSAADANHATIYSFSVQNTNWNITNGGTIANTRSSSSPNDSYAIRLFYGNNTLTLDPGSAITGIVDVGSGTNNVLNLGGDSNGGDSNDAGASTFDISQVGAQYARDGSGNLVQYEGFSTFNKTGSDTWTLTGSNTNSWNQAQNWNLEGGTLALNNATLNGNISTDDKTTGAVTVSVDSTTVNGTVTMGNNGDSTFMLDNTGGASTVTGGVAFSGSGTKTVDFTGSGSTSETASIDSFSGANAFAKDGTGSWTLTQASTQTGAWSVNEGTLEVGNSTALGTGNVTLNGGTLAYDNGIALGNTLQVAKNSTVTVNGSDTAKQTGAISGAAGTTLTKAGSGTYEVGAANANMRSDWDLTAGTILVDASDGLGDGSLALDGGQLTLANGVTLDNALAVNQASTITVAAGDSNSITGPLSGSGAFTKAGDGTLTLAGDSNSYSGAFNVAGGTVNADGVLTATSVNVAAASTLNANNSITSNVTVDGILAGNGAVTGTVTVDSGGHVSQDASKTALKGLTINGDLVMQTGSNIDYNLGAGTQPGSEHALQVDGNVTFEGAVKVNITGSAGTGAPDDVGYYSVVDYTGTETGFNNLSVGTFPGGASYTLLDAANTSGSGGQIQLGYKLNDASMQYWDGSTTTADGSVHGGSGTWSADPGNTDWTDSSGGTNSASADGGNMIFGTVGGTVTVSGNHNFDSLQFITDGYTLNGGTLDLLTGNSNEVRVLDGYTATINSTIDGAGALDKTEGGTLVLGGDNTYTGGTDFNGGVVKVSADDNLGAASGGLTFAGGTLETTADMTTARDAVFNQGGGGLDVDSGTTLTMTGTLSGDGGMVKEGAGTLVLSGDNSYSGGSVLMDGTTQISAGDNLGSGGVALDGGTLESTADATMSNTVALGDKAGEGGFNVDSGTTLTLTGEVGGGELVKKGDGTLVLSGNNVYGGGTDLTAGTVELGNSGAAGSGTISADGGSLAFDDGVKVGNDIALNQTLDASVDPASAVAVEYGTISGSGGLTKTGDGTLILGGNNTYSGDTTVSAGTLVAGDDHAFGSGTVDADGGTVGYLDGVNLDNTVALDGDSNKLNVDDADAVAEQSGALTGTGGFTKTGDGTLILGGDNSYSGNTDVADGTLVVNGSADDSHFTVDNGASLSGDGSIGWLDSHGNLSPGGDDGIGTMHVTNDLTLENDSTYTVTVGPDGSADQIVVGGTANIDNASLNIIAGSGDYQMHTTYDILTAGGGVDGEFGSETVNLPFLTPSMTYDANNAYLTLTRNQVPFSDYGDNQNEKNVGKGLDQMQNNVGENKLLDAVDALAAPDIPHAYQQLSAESYASLQDAAQSNANTVLGSVWDRMGVPVEGDDGSFCTNDQGSEVWVNLPLSQQRVDGNHDVSGYIGQTWGINLGADTEVAPHTRIGVAGSYLSTSQTDSSLNSTGTVNTGSLSVYGQYDIGQWWLGATAGLGVGRMSNTRAINFPGYSSTANGSAPVAAAFAQFGGGYRIPTKAGTVEPIANISVVSTRIGDLTETGGGDADLSVAGSTQTSTASQLGARFSRAFATSSGKQGAFTASLAWQHQLQTPSNTVSAGFVAGQTDMLTYQGWQPPKDSAVIGLGVQLGLSKASSLSFNYQGQVGQGQATNAVAGEYQYHW
jgi:autotransporter-associated beta strand protein